MRGQGKLTSVWIEFAVLLQSYGDNVFSRRCKVNSRRRCECSSGARNTSTCYCHFQSDSHVRSLPILLSVYTQESTLREMERQASMAALVLEQVLTSAVANDVPLAIDLSRTEDAAALAEVGRMRLLELTPVDLKKRVGAAVKLVRGYHTIVVRFFGLSSSSTRTLA